MTIYTQVSRNRAKTVWYLFLYSALLFGLGYCVAWYYGSYSILAIFAIIIVVQGIVSWWLSDTIALAAAQAVALPQALSAEAAARVERLTYNLTIASGLPMPKLYVIQDTAMNAFATGRDPRHASIALTQGIIQSLNDNELSGVIAHELSHIGNEDIRLMSLVMIMAGLIALISDFFLRNMWWSGGRKRDGDGGNIMMLVAIVLAVLAPLASLLIQLAISRKREFLADANAVLLTRYPEGMISALQKISGDEEPLEVANRGNAHMYFANPFKSGAFRQLFSTHPSIESRIEAIRRGMGMTSS